MGDINKINENCQSCHARGVDDVWYLCDECRALLEAGQRSAAKRHLINNAMHIVLTKEDADAVWSLIYNTRSKVLNDYGNNVFADQLGGLLDKFNYPGSSVNDEE